MRGKYSPTIAAAYLQDQDWWRKYTGENEYTYNQYDPEGYDSYGYDKNDVDRAGNHELDYIIDDDFGGNLSYNDALNDWGFDGVKPVKRTGV
jgi:hypothetical protein